MALIPTTFHPTNKVPDDIRECQGCHLKSMGRGDQSGWKGVDAGNGQISWYCDKPACLQARDDFISRRQAEMITEQAVLNRMAQNPAMKPVDDLNDSEMDIEEARLKTRLMAIKTRKMKQEIRQSTAVVEDERRPEPSKVDIDEEEPTEVQFDGVTVHQTRDGINSLCGANGPMFGVGEELPANCTPCVNCAEKLGPSEAVSQPWMEKVAQQMEPEKQAPPPAVDFMKLPQFTPDLIDGIAKGEYDGGQILIPPEAYPDINLETVDLNRIRVGVTMLFRKAELEVDTIQRARKGKQFVGLVFTLKSAQETSGEK